MLCQCGGSVQTKRKEGGRGKGEPLLLGGKEGHTTRHGKREEEKGEESLRAGKERIKKGDQEESSHYERKVWRQGAKEESSCHENGGRKKILNRQWTGNK
jgi:hypothetical protein